MTADFQERLTERIVFSGRVQGVGFRATTRLIAKRYPIAGYVRNQPAGTVELVAQGSRRAIDDLVLAISGDFPGQITSIDRQQFSTTEEFSGFEIRF